MTNERHRIKTVQYLFYFYAAGGFKSFSAACPRLLRSDVWNLRDVSDSVLRDKPNHQRQFPTDTFRCHPSVDQVLVVTVCFYLDAARCYA